MPVVSADLKGKMLDATKGKTDNMASLSALGKAIGDYLNANNKITFAWVGVDPLGKPDPVTTCTGVISGMTVTLTPSMTGEKSVAQLKMSTEVKAGVALGTYTTDNGFSCGVGAMASAPTLSALNLNITGPERDAAYDQMASQIVSWFKALIPTIQVSGSHGSFVGAATPTAIS